MASVSVEIRNVDTNNNFLWHFTTTWACSILSLHLWYLKVYVYKSKHKNTDGNLVGKMEKKRKIKFKNSKISKSRVIFFHFFYLSFFFQTESICRSRCTNIFSFNYKYKILLKDVFSSVGNFIKIYTKNKIKKESWEGKVKINQCWFYCVQMIMACQSTENMSSEYQT